MFSLTSKEILDDLNKNIKWNFISQEEGKKNIYEFNNEKIGCTYFKVEKLIDVDYKSIFDIIKDIDNYDSVITNKTLHTKLVYSDGDSLYAYQVIRNSIPFVKDRQYIFKMYQVSENQIEWYILDRNNDFLESYINDDIKTLSVGAGMWSINKIKDKTMLINKIYINDEINMPELFIKKIKRRHVVNIFNDILNYVTSRR